MKKLRGRITSIHLKAIAFDIHKRELSEEDISKFIRGDRALTHEWVPNPIHASFRVRDPSLFDFALSVLDKDLLITVENGEVVSLEPIRAIGYTCPACHTLVWPDQATRFMTLPEDYRRHSNSTLTIKVGVELSPSQTYYNVKSCIAKNSGTDEWNLRAVVNLDEIENKSEGTRTLVGTYQREVYRVCEDCIAGRRAFRVLELARLLQDSFEKDYRVYSISYIPLIDWKPEFAGKPLVMFHTLAKGVTQ